MTKLLVDITGAGSTTVDATADVHLAAGHTLLLIAGNPERILDRVPTGVPNRILDSTPPDTMPNIFRAHITHKPV